ncbi:MAG: hypothetical protein H0V66_14415 [Bdellovibrionales bacterium]|nr:hypothetical protein [Bdellovibrionales bacterium]
MKRPIIIIIAIVLGIVATNALVPNNSSMSDRAIEDSIETKQAAPVGEIVQ